MIHVSVSLDVVTIIEVAGKHILNNFSRIVVLVEMCEYLFIMTCSSHCDCKCPYLSNAQIKEYVQYIS